MGEQVGDKKRKFFAPYTNVFASYTNELLGTNKDSYSPDRSSSDGEISWLHDSKHVLPFISELLGLLSSTISPTHGPCFSSSKRQKMGELGFVTPPPAKLADGNTTPSSEQSTRTSLASNGSHQTLDSNGDGSSCSHKDSTTSEKTFGISRQFLRQSDDQKVLDLGIVVQFLKGKIKKTVGLKGQDVTVESGLDTAHSIDLLKVFGASNPKLEEIGERVRNGAMLLQEGWSKVNEGRKILEQDFAQISKHIN